MHRTIKILNIEKLENQRSTNSIWISKTTNVEDGLRSIYNLMVNSFKLERISTLDELEDLTMNPPEDIWIFNTHGEVFPVPSKTNWKEYFKIVADNVFENGWCIVNVTGLPFSYYWQGLEIRFIGREVCDTILQRGNNSIAGFLSAPMMRTGHGEIALQKVNVSLREQIPISRCMIFERIDPQLVFYGMSTIYGAASIPIGKGKLIFNGMCSLDLGTSPNRQTDILLGKIGAAFLFYTAIQPPYPPNTIWEFDALTYVIDNNHGFMLRNQRVTGRRGEKVMQEQIENMLRSKSADYRPEVQLEYAGKKRYVDFTVDDYSIAIESKVCNSPADANNILNEINADIIVYKKRYDNLLFVVYDTGGFITNQKKFVEDIESSTPLVRILIVRPVSPTSSGKNKAPHDQRRAIT